jgi:type 1 glutamine amidotransferase
MVQVLMLRHSAGFEHSYLPNAEVTLKELARDSGLFTVTTTHRCENLTPEALARTDVLVFATTGDLPLSEAQKAGLLAFVRAGKGFVGIHNAADTFHHWPEYGEMVGGYFNGHPWTQQVWVNVEDGNHPATRHLGKAVRLFEEVYTFRNWDRQRTHVLLSLDHRSVDLAKGNRPDHDYGLSWCHEYGQGRVMYTGLGHPDDLWYLPWFRQHILGCITWAARLAD